MLGSTGGDIVKCCDRQWAHMYVSSTSLPDTHHIYTAQLSLLSKHTAVYIPQQYMERVTGESIHSLSSNPFRDWLRNIFT